MTNPDEGQMEGRIRSSSEGVHVPVAGYERVIASGKRRRTKGRLLASGIGVAVALAIILPLRSLSHLGDSGTPVASSNQGYLAFTKEVEGKREIWLVRPDGSDLHAVPANLATVAEPSWSPDGNRLAFTGGVAKNTEPGHLYAISPDGSDMEQLTDPPSEVWDMDPTWSPNGDLIAFSRLEDGQGAVAILDAASGSVTMLTGSEFNQANSPAWSPDGTRIAFMANLRGKYGVFVMNADGSEVHPITELDGSLGAESPAWSPDGAKIAFVRGGALYSMNADGTGESEIATGPDVLVADGPEWSPDGSRLAFMGTTCLSGTSPIPISGGAAVTDCDGQASVEVFTVTPQGTDLEQVTTGSGESTGYSPSGIENPSWQPAGSPLEPVATNAEAAPDEVSITCTSDGTVVPPTADVTPQGPRFAIDNQSNAAQVLIAGVSGEARQHAADIELSEATTHTFDLPPGDYVVGCFQDPVEGPGSAEAWSALPGMVPVAITDPDGTYVSSALDCHGQGSDSGYGVAEVPSGSTSEDAIHSATNGIEDEDAIEATGYPGNQGQLGAGNRVFQYRLVRDGVPVALFRVPTVSEGPMIVDVTACVGSGIEAQQPDGPSPTPVGG
jgi:Tol biopolymer transport system component